MEEWEEGRHVSLLRPGGEEPRWCKQHAVDTTKRRQRHENRDHPAPAAEQAISEHLKYKKTKSKQNHKVLNMVG